MRDEYIYRGTCSLIKFESIEESFKRCINNPSYRVVIYVSTSSARYDTMLCITEFSRPFESWILQMTNSHSESAIYFKNGSSIKIVKAGDFCRGYIAHYSLLDDELSDEVIRTLVLPKMIDYNPYTDFINDNLFDAEENNELDEFINSFKINKNT